MAAERVPGSTVQIDVLDRVLDKGIVIDAYVSISILGVWIDLVTVEAHIVVASIETYVQHMDAVVLHAPTAQQGIAEAGPADVLERLRGENAELRRHLASLEPRP